MARLLTKDDGALDLLRQAGAVVEQALFVIDLPELGGADRLREAGITVDALMSSSIWIFSAAMKSWRSLKVRHLPFPSKPTRR